ncbi:MAG TPA: HAD family hydrolase [Myxococcota bacterium]|nr:HAD family hydrolase [Myxococcota bacterium]
MIAFFDLDLTLLSKNSGALWVRSELREGFITPWMALRAMSWLLRYQLGMMDMERAVLAAIASLEGDDEEVVRQRTWRFYDREVAGIYRPGGLRAIEGHRAAGDTIALLTSSSSFMSERAQEQLGLDAVLCNRFEVEGGRFTGAPRGRLCFGKGKLEHAATLATERRVPLSDCTFYTDSASDLPVLEAVGRPVCVHPDLRLRAIARRRGWEVLDWDE